MTVRRRATIDFNAERPAVAAVVKSVLACNPPYRWSREVEPERVFTTNVKPSWWLGAVVWSHGLTAVRP